MNNQKTKKYNIIVIGCQMNKSDSERIAAYLDDLGYEQADERIKADLVVLTTCGVRQEAESRIYGFVPRIKKDNPKVKIVLTGCLSEREDVKRRLGKGVDIWLPIKDLPFFRELLEEKTAISSYKEYLSLRPKYKSNFSAFVPIGNGCDNFCTYCVVPNARGREVYRPFREIILEVKKIVESGFKEITLIAQNVNSYYFDFPLDFEEDEELKEKVPECYEYLKGIAPRRLRFFDLLEICNKIEGDFWIRFSTSHPKDMTDDLIQTLARSQKICRNIHLPAQAGSNEILRLMNRKYTREQYLELINKIKLEFAKYSDMKSENWRPPVSLSTDIIVGFPGETKEQFEKSKELFLEVEYDMAYLARYSPRPGTLAEKMEDNITPLEKKSREEELNDVLRITALKNNKTYLGKNVKVLVDEINRKGELLGKTETNKTVRITNAGVLSGKTEDYVGKFLLVNINEVKDFGMNGVI